MCTPIRKVSLGYEMIDFFLDLWIFPDGRYYILDQDEFNDAIEQGLMDQKQIFEVKAELTRLVDNVKSKRFPSLKVKNLLRLPKNIDKIVYTLEKLSKELAS
jgi:predicted RNA-binding protein associated with RNAse of E/G family